MKYLESISIFIMMLLVTLPFYTAEVFAVDDMIISRKSGADNLDGFLKPYDKVVIEVDAKLDGDSALTNEQVKINDFDFTACTISTMPGYTMCSYESPYYTLTPGSYDFDIDLVRDDGGIALSDSAEVVVDGFGPEIIFNRNPVQNAQFVSVDFTVRDKACDGCTTCSGIDRIEFWDNTNKLNEVELDDECEHSDTMLISASNNVIIKAYDNLGQLSTKTSDVFDADIESPVIDSDFFKIFRGGAELAEHMRSGTYDVDIHVDVVEESLSADKVIMDLSGLGASSALSANSCVKVGNRYTCLFENVEITVDSSKTVNIDVTAKDDFGNTVTSTITRTFNIDETAPSVADFRTNFYFGAQSYIGEGSATIVAEISESGAGFNNKNIYLDLSSLNPLYQDNIQADECNKTGSLQKCSNQPGSNEKCNSQTGSNWQCYWYNVLTPKQNGAQASIYLIDAYDDAGNQATGKLQATINVDKQAPKVILDSLNVTAIGALGRVEFLSSGDDVEIKIEATDKSGIVANGDFSNIYSNGNSIDGTCTLVSGNYLCVWDLDSIASGYLNTDITLNIYDAAGNLEIIEIPIEVYSRDDEENPDYWRIGKIYNMPQALDRQTLPLINQRMYFELDLKSPAGASILQTSLGECTGDIGYVEKSYLYGDTAIVLEMKKTDAKTEDLNITCALNIVSLYNGRVTNLEVEIVDLTVPFYNMPLGEIGTELRSDVDDLYETYVEGWWDYIGQIEKLLHYGTMICNLINTWYQITSLFGTVTEVIGAAGKIIPPSPPKVAAEGARKGFCLTTENTRQGAQNTHRFGEKFCNFVNCKMARPEGAIEGLGDYAAVLGGGGLFGFDINSWPGAEITKDYTGKNLKDYLNVKDSLVLSILTTCLPGIIYNLNKYRQIQCMHMDCMITSLETGVPASSCDSIKEYATCKYVVGEIFQLIPMVAYWDYFIGLVKNAMSDPFSIIGVALAAYCNCASGETYKLCFWPKILAELGTILGDVTNMLDSDHWTVQEDYCEIATDKYEALGGYSG